MEDSCIINYVKVLSAEELEKMAKAEAEKIIKTGQESTIEDIKPLTLK